VDEEVRSSHTLCAAGPAAAGSASPDANPTAGGNLEQLVIRGCPDATSALVSGLRELKARTGQSDHTVNVSSVFVKAQIGPNSGKCDPHIVHYSRTEGSHGGRILA
jgi:hypothetical protein